MASLFRKAEKIKAPLRLGITGPSGSGKTMTALRIAKGLGGPIVFLDTERGSASKYSFVADFHVLELDDFEPREFIKAIDAAEREFPGGVLIIDSVSAAWAGRGGALEAVDLASKKTGNSYTAWKDVTPKINALVDRILTVKMHVIACFRSKVEHKLEPDARGKMVPRKVGIAPIFKDNVEYEYDVFGTMTPEHELLITKTRCPELTDKIFFEPGEDVALLLTRWLEHGAVAAPPPPSEEKIDQELGRVLTTAQSLERALRETKTPTEIEAVVEEIKRASLSDDEKARLGVVYSDHVSLLNGAA